MDIINATLELVDPDVSTLYLAVETDQEKVIKIIRPKVLTDSVSTVITEIDRFCSMIEETKQRRVPKERKEKLRKNIGINRQMILQSLKPRSPRQNSSRKEFECPICYEDMKAPLQIFACSSDHYFCSECLSTPLERCSLCREDFSEHPPERRHAAEKYRQM